MSAVEKKYLVGQRPQTLREVTALALSGADEFGPALSEFLDEAKRMSGAALAKSLADEPYPLGGLDGGIHFWRDAYLAAAAEYLSVQAGIDSPAWSESPKRFLKEPWYDNSGYQSINRFLDAESPPAFRRRNIYTESRPLRRA